MPANLQQQQHQSHNKPNLSIVSFNTCGTNSPHRRAEIQLFLQYEKPDVLIIQEPKIKNNKGKKPPNFYNYNTLYFPHPNKPTGIIFYVHQSLIANKLTIPHWQPYSIHLTTICAFIQLQIPSLSTPLTIAGVYMSNKSPKEDVQHLISNITTQSKIGPIIAMGDFNARHITWDPDIEYTANPNGRFLQDCIRESLINPNIPTLHLLNNIFCKLKATHTSYESDSVIDLALTMTPSLVQHMEVLYETYISSDHYPIRVSLNIPSQQTDSNDYDDGKIPSHMAWDIDHADWKLYKTTLDMGLQAWITKFTEWMKTHPNPSLTTQREINKCWNELHKIISTTAELCVGKRHVKHTSKHWWNDSILNLSKQYRKAEREYFTYRSRRKNTSPHILNTLRQQRNKARNVFRVVVREAKQTSSNKLTESVDACKKVAWSQLRRLTKGASKPITFGTFNSPDGTIPKSRQESVDNLSHHLAAASTVPTHPSFDTTHHEMVEQTIDDDEQEQNTLTKTNPLPFTMKQLIEACSHAKLNTALGTDEISPHFLRQGGSTLHTALYLLFSICYGHGRIPSDFKHAKIVAIYKQSGDTDDPNNYRPISITSIVMRLWEKLMKQTLLQYMEKMGIPSPHQFGFTKQRSTYDAIFRLLSNIVDSFEDPPSPNPNGNYVPAIFIDIAKAYDKVWIPGLLYKLKQLNLDPHFYHFLKAFLTGRTFQVVHSGHISILQKLMAGVPQGSVLAPLLFILYIHGIAENISPRTMISLFADDLALQPKGITGSGSMRPLQRSLNAITKYANKWKIAFSVKKTNVIFFRPRPLAKTAQRVPSYPAKQQTLTLTGFNIAPTLMYTYLGIVLDQYLTLNQHQQLLVANTIKTSFMISRLIRRDFPPSFPVVRQLVASILIPKITYGLPFFTIVNKQVQTTRNIAMRSIPEARMKNEVNMYRKIKNIIIRPLLRSLGLPFRTHHNSVFIESRLLPIEILQAKHAAAYANRLLTMDTTNTTQPNEAASLMKLYLSKEIAHRRKNKTKNSHPYHKIHPFHRLLRLCQKVPGLSPTDSNFMSTPPTKHADIAWAHFYKKWYDDQKDHSLPPHYTQETPQRKLLPTYLLHDDPSTAARRARLRLGRALIAFCWYHSGNKKTSPECKNCKGGENNNTNAPYLIETVAHIIEQCPKYQNQRIRCSILLQKISPNIPFNIQTVLSPHEQPLLRPHLIKIHKITGIFIQSLRSIRKF
jgi:exonuclease III